MTRTWIRNTMALALALAAAVPAAAQDEQTPPQAPASAFGEVIDVRVVNVEVVVTDKDGVRVTGLAPADFELVVDGEKTSIEYFTEVRGGDAVMATGEAPPVPGLPALAPGESVGTSYLVFIDDFFSIARDRDQVIEALAEDLPMLTPEDRMAVVAYDGRRLTMLSSWSQSQRELERALKEAQRRPALGLQRLAERRSFDLNFSGVGVQRAGGFTQLSVEERAYTEQLESQVAESVGAVAATLRSFASPPGRKILLLLSGGWPYSPASFAVDNSARAIADTGTVAGQELYAPLTDTANLIGYTVYPIDLPGLGNDFGADAARGGQQRVGLGLTEDRFADTALIGSRERERDVQQALYHVAEETGGRALINAQRLDAFPEVVADTRSYYWIGFIPSRNRDDRVHDIRVALTRPGLEVRTRETFRDLSRAAETEMAVESALLFGDTPSAASLPVTAGEPVAAGRRFMELPIRLVIPVEAMTLVPLDGSWVARFELRVAALDDSARRSDIPVVPVELTFKEHPGAGTAIPFETRLKLRREKQTLVVSVHDPIGGASLTSRLEVSP